MLNAFDGHMFRPHGIITALPIRLGCKTIFVEVVDAPMEYNLLLGCNFFYEMIIFFSLFFMSLCFPHKGNIVTIDQHEFCTPKLMTNAGSNIPFVDDS
jgi:hypothetical protein